MARSPNVAERAQRLPPQLRRTNFGLAFANRPRHHHALPPPARKASGSRPGAETSGASRPGPICIGKPRAPRLPARLDGLEMRRDQAEIAGQIDRAGLGEEGLPAEGHGAEGEDGYLEAGAAEEPIFHVFLPGPCCYCGV
jgi:hypothetical protein